MGGFQATHLDQVVRAEGIRTLTFGGVNTDECVSTTMEGAYFRDYAAVLLTDATATFSPGYCKDTVVFNAQQCWASPPTPPAWRRRVRRPGDGGVHCHHGRSLPASYRAVLMR